MASILADGGTGPGRGTAGLTRCLLLLQRSLAIQLSRGSATHHQQQHQQQQGHSVASHAGQQTIGNATEHPADEMWMYDKGYNLFQSFLEANSKCWWNSALVEATRQLRYNGHVAPGILMVGGPACALEVLRAAWSRNVLRPPADHSITCLGDVEDCIVAPVSQGQFTPLPEALCWAILELTSQRQTATLDTLRLALRNAFPTMQKPSRELVYDALAKLAQEQKIYHTAQGYFVVTPEARRLRRDAAAAAAAVGSHRRGSASLRDVDERGDGTAGRRQGGILMSNDEAMAFVHGEMITLRDGTVTHQAIQTNLTDVICGGNPNDKVLFARCRSMPGRLERRHSLRLWGSARRLHRSGSLRSLSRRHDRSDTSSSTEYAASTDSAPQSPAKKMSLLSRLFRRSTFGRKGAPLVGTFSAQYPPTEWFNPRVVHLHSVATQTSAASPSMSLDQSQASFHVWDDTSSMRSATLPRRHRRQPSGDSSSLLANSSPTSSTRRHRSPSSILPRSKCSSSISRCTSRTSVQPTAGSTPCRQQHSNDKTSVNSSSSRSGESSGSVKANGNADSTTSAGNVNGPTGQTGVNNVGNRSSLRRHASSRRSSQDSSGYNGVKSNANGSLHQKVFQKTSSGHSLRSTDDKHTSSPLKMSVLPTKLSPLKVVQHQQQQQQQQSGYLSPLQETQSSITVQVSTNLSRSPSTVGTPTSTSVINSGIQLGAKQEMIHNSVTLASSASGTTISSSPGTKIYVQRNNSPTRTTSGKTGHERQSRYARRNEKEVEEEEEEIGDFNEKQEREVTNEKAYKSSVKDVKDGKNSKEEPVESLGRGYESRAKLERPSSLYASKDSNRLSEGKEIPSRYKLTNQLNNSQAHLTNENNVVLVVGGGGGGGGPASPSSLKNATNDAMNNSHKLGLAGLTKEALSYKNILRPGSKANCLATSGPPSPTKSSDGFGGSFGNVYIENFESAKPTCQRRGGPQGSQPDLAEVEKTTTSPFAVETAGGGGLCSCPSLNDIQVQFTSLAAQKILKGCPLNSVDTLIEVNTAAAANAGNDKPNNCDITVHTDFGHV